MAIIYFSITPVQSFIAEARKTRDLWSGSFLLSYLSGCAMMGVGNDGKIIDPYLGNENPIWNHLKNGGIQSNSMVTGSLPNQFIVEVDDNKINEVADNCIHKFNECWNMIAEKIYDKYLKQLEEAYPETKKIWNRQVKNYWNIMWVAEDYQALKGRKNWKWKDLEAEPGDHCSIMANYQELSGYIRKNNKDKQDEFWGSIRKKAGKLDLDEDERLCAIAFIKRFFPKIAKEAINWDLNVKNWPSTVYMAAVPWFRKNSINGFGDEYYNKVCSDDEDYVKNEKIPENIGLITNNKLPTLNGNFFFIETLSSEKATPLKGEEKRQELIKMLKNLHGESTHENNKPSPYYALLLMDGDNIGKTKAEGDPKVVSKSLSKFSNNVGNIVKRFNGVTIYAGGDDVLAMLPADTAIDCAHELYKAFKEMFKEIDVSISAGIVISHYHQPLKKVYMEAKSLLENVAKEQNGKNSIAISVLKGSEKHLQWVTNWKLFNDENLLKNAVAYMADISKSMIYSIRETLIQLLNNYKGEAGTPFDIAMSLGEPVEPIFEKLLLSDMLRSREKKDKKADEKSKTSDEDKIKAIIQFCMVNPNNNDNNKEGHKFQIDGLFLLKFLSDIQKNKVIENGIL